MGVCQFAAIISQMKWVDNLRPAATSMASMEQNERTDADLVAQTLAGDCEAFGHLYDRHARIVRAVVGGISLDWSTVEDMVQVCFLRAYRNLDKLRDPQRFGPWIVGFARQVARERKRSLRRDRHQFIGRSPVDIESPANAAREVQDADELDLLMRKLANLPDRERLAIHAFFLREHDVRQAAELLELSRSGFYALLQRALSRLAALVKPREPQEEAKK